MKSKAWLGTGMLLLLAGCTAKPETETTDTKKLLAELHDLSRATSDCVGRLHRDSVHAVSGTSECRNGAGVFFSGRSDATLAEGLSCDYTLTYTGDNGGTGRIACTDGSNGDFRFEETDSTHGVATVRLKDGREIKLTYTQSS
jgi:hypothetical protein